MSYRNIKDIVQQSFEDSRDLRIDHTITQRGASHLLSAVFDKEDAEERKFYRKPKLAEGDETKLAIIYGETMITPYIIDIGVGNGINDPENITRTIRFIAGDGESGGVVTGPNGSELENVYMGSEGEAVQPVIDDDGMPSTKDIIIASALGGLVSSVPKIWDAITTAAPDADKIGEANPVTGEKILSKEEKIKNDNIASAVEVSQLKNVDSTVTPEGDYILVFDNCKKEWVPKPMSEMVGDNLSITEGTDGTDGTAGTPGTAGSPATPPTDEYVTEADPIVLPDTDLQKDPGVAANQNTLGGMTQLVDITTNVNNQYKEMRDVAFTKGIILNFMFEGIGLNEVWDEANNTDPTSDFPCLEGDAPGNPGTASDAGPGTVKINVCLSINACGSDYAFYETVFEYGGQSKTDFTRHL